MFSSYDKHLPPLSFYSQKIFNLTNKIMESRKETIIKEIFDKLEDALYEQDEFDIEKEVEFGGVEASISASIEYKNCTIECTVSYHAHSKDWLEVIIYPDNEKHSFANLEEAVNDYFEKHFDMEALLDEMEDKVIENEEDEWTSHGFRNEADYYHWRYG